MNDWTSKDFRKAAFAVGFGFTMGKIIGKFTGEYVLAVGKYACEGFLKCTAKKGFESSQEWCRKLNLEYEPKQKNDDEPKMKIGFC